MNLAAHLNISKELGLQTFEILGHSHKLQLIPFPKLKAIQGDDFQAAIPPAFEEKERLAQIAVKEKLSVREFSARIKRELSKNDDTIDLTQLPPPKDLRKRDQKELTQLYNLTRAKIDDEQGKIQTYSKALYKLGAVLSEHKGGPDQGKGRFRDWTLPGNNVNICTGCKNDCLYCYANIKAQQRKQVKPGEWPEFKIRKHDVEESRKLYNGLVGFLSSHDIFPEILDDYLIVLGKLLRAGNEVLIVSKPNLECIKEICKASIYFKDKILFRFTIGAMNEEILSFWEPNAPNYEERMASLKYTFDKGFRTSISMEPMLDTPQIERTIANLRPFVTEDIWLGTMNHLNPIKAGADERLAKEIAIIEAGQTPEMLLAIYDTFKDDPLIKWKTDALNAFATARNRKTTKGWDIVKIKNDVGDEIDAVAPLIISASRRNDTPARHGQWVLEGIKRGHIGYKNKYVSFEKARLIMFWTKDPEPIIEHLDKMNKKGIGYYFQYTLNDYEAEKLEPNLPPLEERIETFKALAKKIGKAKVIWRFDPLILTDTITKEHLVEKVENLMGKLTGYTEKLVISFFRSGDYKHALKRMEQNKINLRDFEADDITFIATKLGVLGKKYNMKVATCADKGDLSLYGIESNKCIDDELIKRVFKDDEVLMSFLESRKNLKDSGQRKDCGCIVSEDIGTINTCANGCLYCYANKSDVAVKRNLKKIENGEIGEFLVPKKSSKLKN